MTEHDNFIAERAIKDNTHRFVQDELKELTTDVVKQLDRHSKMTASFSRQVKLLIGLVENMEKRMDRLEASIYDKS